MLATGASLLALGCSDREVAEIATAATATDPQRAAVMVGVKLEAVPELADNLRNGYTYAALAFCRFDPANQRFDATLQPVLFGGLCTDLPRRQCTMMNHVVAMAPPGLYAITHFVVWTPSQQGKFVSFFPAHGERYRAPSVPLGPLGGHDFALWTARAGEINYFGDFTFDPTTNPMRLVRRGENDAAAREALKDYPLLKATFRTVHPVVNRQRTI